jgi:hypothetical protein
MPAWVQGTKIENGKSKIEIKSHIVFPAPWRLIILKFS